MVKKIIDNYNEKINEIDCIYRTKKYKFITGLISFLMAVLIIIGPVTLFINMYMYYDIYLLLSIGLVICFFLLFYLSRIFYLKGITENKIKLDVVYLVEGITILLFVIVVLLFL